jgi:hypothetical protein
MYVLSFPAEPDQPDKPDKSYRQWLAASRFQLQDVGQHFSIIDPADGEIMGNVFQNGASIVVRLQTKHIDPESGRLLRLLCDTYEGPGNLQDAGPWTLNQTSCRCGCEACMAADSLTIARV